MRTRKDVHCWHNIYVREEQNDATFSFPGIVSHNKMKEIITTTKEGDEQNDCAQEHITKATQR